MFLTTISREGYGLLMTHERISHRGHDHDTTPAARAACRKSMAGFFAARDRIDAHATPAVRSMHLTGVGTITVGMRVEVQFTAGAVTRVTITAMHDDIKNGRPGFGVMYDNGNLGWTYATQVVRIIPAV